MAVGSIQIILIIAIIVFTFLPIYIAFYRKHKYRWMILVLNFFLGWTGIVWLGLTVWAIVGETEDHPKEH